MQVCAGRAGGAGVGDTRYAHDSAAPAAAAERSRTCTCGPPLAATSHVLCSHARSRRGPRCRHPIPATPHFPATARAQLLQRAVSSSCCRLQVMPGVSNTPKGQLPARWSAMISASGAARPARPVSRCAHPLLPLRALPEMGATVVASCRGASAPCGGMRRPLDNARASGGLGEHSHTQASPPHARHPAEGKAARRATQIDLPLAALCDLLPRPACRQPWKAGR